MSACAKVESMLHIKCTRGETSADNNRYSVHDKAEGRGDTTSLRQLVASAHLRQRGWSYGEGKGQQYNLVWRYAPERSRQYCSDVPELRGRIVNQPLVGTLHS